MELMSRVMRLIFGDQRDPRQQLADVFGVDVPSSGDVQPEILAWGRTIVQMDTMTEVEAIRAIRRAEPKLGLKSAYYLTQKVFNS